MTVDDLKAIAKILADDFKVKYNSVTELPNTEEHLGQCDLNKNIAIRLKQYKRNKELKPMTVMDTLCHEMAHILFFEHGKKHRAVVRLMLKRAISIFGDLR